MAWEEILPGFRLEVLWSAIAKRRMREARTWRDFMYARFHRLDPHYRRMDKLSVARLLSEAGLPAAQIISDLTLLPTST